MKEKIIKYKNAIAIISAFLLFVAIAKLPYGYYIFLRWFITFSAIFLIWVAYKLEKIPWIFLMGIVAILFNPIIPVYLNKSTWVFIDFIVALLFLTSQVWLKTEEEKIKEQIGRHTERSSGY